MLRAGPFSDERVVRIINDHFVPFAFDLFPGALADRAARDFLVKRRPEFGGASISNEPLMVVSPDGKILGETIRYGNPLAVLGMLRKAKLKEPADPLARARQRNDLLDHAGAEEILATLRGDDAKRLRVQVALDKGDTAAAQRLLQDVKNPGMLRARLLWKKRAWDKLQGIEDKGPEADYLRGLALFHRGRKEAALAAWKKLIQGGSGPWVYRADWAYTNVKGGHAMTMSTSGPRTSLLGRIGYMGPRNPDLR